MGTSHAHPADHQPGWDYPVRGDQPRLHGSTRSGGHHQGVKKDHRVGVRSTLLTPCGFYYNWQIKTLARPLSHCLGPTHKGTRDVAHSPSHWHIHCFSQNNSIRLSKLKPRRQYHHEEIARSWIIHRISGSGSAAWGRRAAPK